MHFVNGINIEERMEELCEEMVELRFNIGLLSELKNKNLAVISQIALLKIKLGLKYIEFTSLANSIELYPSNKKRDLK